jgi:hypothetical protein
LRRNSRGFGGNDSDARASRERFHLSASATTVQEKGETMKGKYPGGMTLTQWRRLPFMARHRLVGLTLNAQFGYWRSCADARCRRARTCQDYTCYWRRMRPLSHEEMMRVRGLAEPLEKILWIGSRKGSQGRPLF